jgi:hypothetical protein
LHETDEADETMTNSKLNRREFLARLTVVPIITALPPRGARPPVTVYKTPTCGCCKKWVEHIEKAGFKVTVKDMADVSPVRKDLGVPEALASCHTAVLGAYVVEGHVPADVIDKMLKEKPAGRGLTIPGMPQSAPGMDIPGQPYNVLLFTRDGKTKVYASRDGRKV